MTNMRPTTRRFSDQARSLSADAVLEAWKRRKWLAVLVFSTAVVGAGAIAFSLPDLYRAKATVLVGRQQVSEEFVRSAVTTELETRIQTIQQQVMSRERLTDLIVRLNLYPRLREKVDFESVVETMRRDVRLDFKGADSLSGRASTISFAVNYTGRDPQTVALVANTLAAAYVEANVRSRAQQSAQTAEFLKQQLAETKLELTTQEQRVSEFKLRHGVELPEQFGSNLAALERLNAQLRLNGEYQIRAMERRERIETQLGLPTAGAPGTFTQADTPLSKRKQELALLQRQFSDKYPDVIRLKEEIAALEQQTAQSAPRELAGTNGDGTNGDTTSAAKTPAPVGTNGSQASTRAGKAPAPPDAGTPSKHPLGAVSKEIASLRQEEAFLRRAIAGYEARVENAPQREQELQRLSFDYKTTKDRYETLLKRYEEAQLADSLEQGQNAEQFRILDSALPPQAPAAPNRLLLLLLGLASALAFTCSVVFAAEKLDTSFHSIEDLQAFADVPTLAAIRVIVTDGDIRRQRIRLALMVVFAVLGLVVIAAIAYRFGLDNEQIVRMVSGGRR